VTLGTATLWSPLADSDGTAASGRCSN
jgi:hypothetical protein